MKNFDPIKNIVMKRLTQLKTRLKMTGNYRKLKNKYLKNIEGETLQTITRNKIYTKCHYSFTENFSSKQNQLHKNCLIQTATFLYGNQYSTKKRISQRLKNNLITLVQLLQDNMLLNCQHKHSMFKFLHSYTCRKRRRDYEMGGSGQTKTISSLQQTKTIRQRHSLQRNVENTYVLIFSARNLVSVVIYTSKLLNRVTR